jgi:hypothetical protein
VKTTAILCGTDMKPKAIMKKPFFVTLSDADWSRLTFSEQETLVAEHWQRTARPVNCHVRGCKREAAHEWESWMSTPDKRRVAPVCDFHYRRRLWWYKGWIFDRDEEGG